MKRVIVSTLSILYMAGIIFSQQHNNDSDKTLRGSGRVNPSTLAMEFDLPLGSYPGRGINVPISLSYSSKLWRMDYTGDTPGGVITGGCRSLNHAEYAENSASGWTTSLAVPYIEYTGKDQLFTHHGFSLEGYDQTLCDPNAPPTYYQNAWIRRLSIHLPSGETHELRADDEPVVYSPSSMCPPQYGYSCDPNSYWLQENWNRTFYAVDGSNIRYVEDSTTNTYRLLMPDGSFYDFSNSITAFNNSTARKATKYTDRNGNFTTYNDATGAWTDTLGRTLTPPIGHAAPTEPTTAGNPIVYTMPGMTGSYKFHWKRLKGVSPAESALTDFSQNLKYRGDKITMTGNGNWSVRLAGTYLFSSEWDAYVTSWDGLFNPVVLTEIELPTGQKYKFSYDLYGRIEKIMYPTGGEEKFQYAVVAALSVPGPSDVSGQTNHGVVNRKVYETAGDPTPYEWTYSAGHVAPAGYVATVNNPDGTKTQRVLHQGLGPCIGCSEGNFGFDNGLVGMAYEELSFNNAGTIVSRKLTQWAKKSFGRADWHPRVTQEESVVYDDSGNGVSATTTYNHEGDLNLREAPVLVNKATYYPFEARTGGGQFTEMEPPCMPDEENCDPPPPPPTPTPVPTPAGPPIKIVETTYLINDSAYTGVKSYYTAQNMVGLVTASQVKDGAGTIMSRSETVYDEISNYPLVTPGSPTHWAPPPWGFRGNPNTVKVWDSTKGVVTNPSAYIATHAQFDNFGNQIKAWDAKGNFTTTAFDTTYYAFPVQVTSPVPDPTGQNGSNTAFITTATFNTTTGLPLTTTDANSLRTEIEYDPVTLRPLNTKTYFGGNQVGSMAETIYHDEPGNYWVKNRAQIDTNVWAETITYFDGLGRAWKTEEINSKGNISVEKEFDAEGRPKRVSNPFRAGETKVWTTNAYDEASRVKEVVLQDGATVKTDYGVSITTPIGVTKQITDQANKKRKGISDALGRMIRVIEDPTGTTPLNTDYVFDTLGNLRKTIQGEQNRFFMYDSLGRLLYAKQPEQDTRTAFVTTDTVTGNTAWSVKYEYDDNGNITKTTDARGVYIQGTYDNLNRLKVRDYSDSTSDASFFYDGKYLNINDQPQTATGSVKGKTTGVKSSASRTNYTSFDNLGRLLTHHQITDGQAYGTSYTYNLSGGLVSETYPSGRTVNYDINSDGDLSRVWGHRASTVTTYANAFNYNATGAVEKMRLGNGKWETASYNNRLQITQIGLGTGSNDTSLLKLEYGYGTPVQNNGNLRTQKISFNGLAQPFEQTYTYDDMNRLQVAEEKVSTTTTWKQTFVIDQYGNREFDPANTTTLGSCPQAVCNPDINTANNRFVLTPGYQYDANGNLTRDAEGKRFSYDAENHQKEFFVAGNSTTVADATYSYDGEGKRVKKISPLETTVFVYNANGTLVAEYSTQTAQTPQTSYLTTDHLGSPRVVTNQHGTVTTRKDFTAFGEENQTPQRTSALGYATPDNLRKGYTGYEKDDESGLDFAQARYYNSTHGRYTSIDPLTASITIRNPQTFNRYSYVLNSPYKYTDPLGLLPTSWNTSFGGGGFCSASQSSCEEGEDITTASIEAYQKKKQEQERKRQEEKRKKQQENRKKKQQAKKPTPPPPPAKKDGPKPASATVTLESVGPNAEPVGGGKVKAGSMAVLTISVVGDDGQPFSGIANETVTSTVNGVATNTVTSNNVPVTNGQLIDIVAPPGLATGNRMPTEAEIGAISAPMENTPYKIEQTATITISGPNTNATLTVVHKRTLTNVDANGVLRPVRNGTRYVFYDRGTTVTSNSP